MNTAAARTARRTFGPAFDRTRRNYRHIRVLRWTFHRDKDEWVVCELALTGDDREYEIRVPAEWNPTGCEVERFDDAMAAFQRHAMIERQLLDAGWALDGFEGRGNGRLVCHDPATGKTRELRVVGEAVDPGDLADEPGGGDDPEAVLREQRRCDLGHELREFLVELVDRMRPGSYTTLTLPTTYTV